MNFEREKIQSAGDYLDEIEGYSLQIHWWSVVAQLTVDGTEYLQDRHATPSRERAENVVAERCKKLISAAAAS